MAPSKDQSWTLAPETDGALELGVGVVMPRGKARRGSADLAASIHRPDLVKGRARPAGARAVPRARRTSFPRALEPVEELMIVSLPVTDDAVQGVRAFAAKTGLKLVAHEAQEPCDQWMQDTIQPGLFAFPTAAGSEQARASLTGLRKESTDLGGQRSITRSPGGCAATEW